MHVLPLRKHFANRHLHSPESKTAKIFHSFCMHDKQKQIPTKKKRKQQQKQTKNQRNKVVYFLFLSFVQPQKLQILFINRCVRHKSESCHSPDMVGEPLFFFLLLLLFVFLLPLRRIADRPRHTHKHILRCEYRPRLGQQRERERARWRQLSVAFSLLLMLSTSVCSSPHLLCSPYFVSSAKLIAKSIFYLATVERGEGYTWHPCLAPAPAIGAAGTLHLGCQMFRSMGAAALFYLFLHRVLFSPLYLQVA